MDYSLFMGHTIEQYVDHLESELRELIKEFNQFKSDAMHDIDLLSGHLRDTEIEHYHENSKL